MVISSFTLILMGAVFGLSAGMSPGPLLTLVITQTLKHNRKEGVKVAFVPLITDFPIIAITFFVFSRFSQSNLVFSIISFVGKILYEKSLIQGFYSSFDLSNFPKGFYLLQFTNNGELKYFKLIKE